jgi:hypothetical protein
MRSLVLLLLAWPAVAAPSVRWIDRVGTVRRQDVQKVVTESVSEVSLRTTEGKGLTLPVSRILTLIREDDQRAEERSLLHARQDVAAGLRLDQARPVLDRLATSGTQPWIREYAAAARALLAERAGEKDARARIDRFLGDHAESRFVSAMHVAVGRLRARDPGLKDPLEGVLVETSVKVAKLQGPLLLRLGVVVDGMRIVTERESEILLMYPKFVSGFLADNTGRTEDPGVHLVAHSCQAWATLVRLLHEGKRVIAHGNRPSAALADARRLRDGSTLWLPELRSDVHRELGFLMVACGDPAGARAELEKARNLAPDRVRREAAEGALKRLE